MNFSRYLPNLVRSPNRFLQIHIKHTERTYAKSVLGTVIGKGKLLGAAFDKKKLLPVETDPEKLVNYCCGSNILKEGEDVKLKDDSEYPDWLWNLRLGPPPPLEEMDPNTLEYWEYFFFLQHIRKLRLKKVKQKVKLRINEEDQMTKLRMLKYRALAHRYDPGYDSPPRFDKEGWKIW